MSACGSMRITGRAHIAKAHEHPLRKAPGSLAQLYAKVAVGAPTDLPSWQREVNSGIRMSAHTLHPGLRNSKHKCQEGKQ